MHQQSQLETINKEWLFFCCYFVKFLHSPATRIDLWTPHVSINAIRESYCRNIVVTLHESEEDRNSNVGTWCVALMELPWRMIQHKTHEGLWFLTPYGNRDFLSTYDQDFSPFSSEMLPA